MTSQPKKRIELILDHVLNVTKWTTASLILLMMLLVVSEVFQRYVLKQPSQWISDFISEFLLIYITMLPAGWILLQEGHVSVELIVAYLNVRQRYYLSVVTNILGLIYSIVLTWQGWIFMWGELMRGTTFPTTVRLPVWPAVGSIFIGGVFMSAAFILKIAGRHRLYRNGHSHSI